MAKRSKREYFSHYLDSHTEPEQVKLRRELGFEGVGIFWVLIKRLCAQGESMELSALSEFSYEFRLDSEKNRRKLDRIIRDYGLFDVDEAVGTFSLRGRLE